MASKNGLIIARKIPVRFSPVVKSSWFHCRFVPISSRASYDPSNNSNYRKNISDDDTTYSVRQGIVGTIDTAKAVGDNTKEAMEAVWEDAKDDAETIKERMKDSRQDPHRGDVADNGWDLPRPDVAESARDPAKADVANAIENAVEEEQRKKLREGR